VMISNLSAACLINSSLCLTVRSFFLVLRKLVKRYMWSFEPALLDDLLEF
jgi:hypothetical protein